MGFYVTGSSFRTRPPLSPHPHRLPRRSGLAPAHRHTDTTRTPRLRRTGAPRIARCARRCSSTDRIRPVPDVPSFPFSDALPHRTDPPRARADPSDEAEVIPTQPFPTSHDASTSREETIRLSPFLSTRAPTDTITSRAWSSRRIPRSFGLTAPRAHPETIGLLSRGVRSPVIYAPRNTS
jgi:hypothetical protein